MIKLSKILILFFVAGAAIFSVVNSGWAQTAISYGQALSGTISVAGEKDEFTFSGVSGEVVTIRFGGTGTDFYPYVELYNPSGTKVSYSYSSSLTTTLNASGTWKIVLQSSHSPGTGNYGLAIQCVNNPQGASAISFGQTATGNVDSFAKIVSYKFSANSNDKILLNFLKLNQTLGYFYPYVELYDPNGNKIAYIFSGALSATLPVTGQYCLLVTDYYNYSTGAFELSLQRTNNPANAKDINYNAVIKDSISAPTGMNAYRFSANTNDTITICSDVEGQVSGYVELKIYDSSGARVAYSYTGSLKYTFTASGTFYLFANALNFGGTGTYNFIVLNRDADCLSIDLASPEILLLSPADGEIVDSGSTYNISWTSSDNVGVVSQEIRLSTDGGVTYPTIIAQGLSGTVQSYNWAVSANLSTLQARIKITAQDAQGNKAEANNQNNFVIFKTALPSEAAEVNYTYDTLNRLTASTSAFSTLFYTYDSLGNRLQLSSANVLALGGVNPDSGSSFPNQAVSFTTTYIDPKGWQNLQYCLFLINTAVSAPKSCYLYYNPQLNKLYLRNDAGNAWLGGFAPGSANTIENSYAKLDCANTTVSGSGSLLAINWRVTFKRTFIGAKNSYLCLWDKYNTYVNWTQKGSWTINNHLGIDSLTPTSGSSPANQPVNFTTVFSDTDGYQNLQYCLFLINTSVNASKCFYGYYNPQLNKLYLRNDAGNAWLGGFAPGSANTIENSYAKLDCANTTVTGSGNTLTVSWKVTFKSAFISTASRNGYLCLYDKYNSYANWTQKGTYTISAKPIDIYTKLLLHADGANGSTSFIDDSSSVHPITAFGNTRISTAQYKFGGASAFFDGSGDYLASADSQDWNFGSGEFTVELWVKLNNTAGRMIVLNQSVVNAVSNSALGLWIGPNGANTGIYVTNGGGAWDKYAAANITLDTNWHHFAGVRTANTLKFFWDGVEKASTALPSGYTINNSSRVFEIGAQNGSNYFNGWIDEVRISKGIARWTSNFTPPTQPYDK